MKHKIIHWWICTFTVSVFLCLSLSFSDSGFLYTFISGIHMCVCVRAREGYEITSAYIFCLYSACPHVMPRSKCLDPTSEAQRCEQERRTHEKENLCHRHGPQWCGCVWLEDADKAVNHVCQTIAISFSHCQTKSDFKNGIYLDT